MAVNRKPRSANNREKSVTWQPTSGAHRTLTWHLWMFKLLRGRVIVSLPIDPLV